MTEATTGIIGGGGLCRMDAMTDVSKTRGETPFRPPGDAIVPGTLETLSPPYVGITSAQQSPAAASPRSPYEGARRYPALCSLH